MVTHMCILAILALHNPMYFLLAENVEVKSPSPVVSPQSILKRSAATPNSTLPPSKVSVFYYCSNIHIITLIYVKISSCAVPKVVQSYKYSTPVAIYMWPNPKCMCMCSLGHF